MKRNTAKTQCSCVEIRIIGAIAKMAIAVGKAKLVCQGGTENMCFASREVFAAIYAQSMIGPSGAGVSVGSFK